jgi:hypothetical protein
MIIQKHDNLPHFQENKITHDIIVKSRIKNEL